MSLDYISGMTAAEPLTGDELVEVSQLSATVTITGTTISADGDDNSFNDSANGFVAADFEVGMRVNVVGFTGNVANNIFVGTITILTAGKMTIGGTDGDVIVDDAAGESVTITAWESHRTTVQEIADLAGAVSVNAQVGTTYTPVLADANNVIELTNAAAITLTIPDNADVAFPIGTVIEIHQGGAGTVTFAEDTSVTILSRGGLVDMAGEEAVAAIRKVDTDTWRLTGDIA